MKKTTKAFLLFMLFIIPFGLMAQNVTITGDSTINQCETKTYTIHILNNSGNALTRLVITAKLQNFTDFSYVNGTTIITTIDLGGNPPISCTPDPIISGGYTGLCAPAPSAPYLTWDIDTLCGGPFTLDDGETLNISFNLETDCNAVSGSLNTLIDYEISGTPFCDDTGAHSIQVLPGGVTIKKTPNVIPQELWQNVTWTLTVENTGFGIIENVVVTDVLGAGLAYVSSSPAGVNAGQTTTWGTAEIPGFASMNPGDIITIDITAQVIFCEFLENNADVRWGCDMVTDCYNTAVTIPPSTATASVQRIVKTPLLEYTPPDVGFNYCEDYVDVNFTVTNIGDGRAHDVWLYADFGSLAVSNVSAGAVYNDIDKRFELTNPLAAAPGPGNTYDLGFRLTFSTWCGGGFPSGDLLWLTVYKDDCDNEFYPPVKLSTINAPANSSSLLVGKTGAPSAIQIGGQIIYNITSSYSGPLSCGSGPGATSDITVVDTIPDGFSVVDSGGGTYVPGAGGTGGTITWTYTPPASLNTSITIQVPPTTDCETYCFTTFTNTIQATGTDCCGCALGANSSQTTAIECEELVDSEKTAVPTTGIRCDTIRYTNTYVFADNAALDSVDLSQLIFQEDADNEQEYDPGSLAVTLSGSGDITACALSGLTDTTPGAGGNLIINFSNCSTYGTVRNKTLTITYRLRITEATVGACSGATFYSWSALDLNLITGNQCLPDGIIYETTVVSVDPPAMSVSITGLGQIVHKCESQTITITLTQTSGTADPRDVRLVLSGLNYYVVNPAATICGGVAPVSCIPAIVGGDYVWEFGDAFTGSGQSATLQLAVQKRCTGSGDLVATAYFDDNCNDDGNYDDTCSTTAVETPALLLSGDLLIEKNPEVVYASVNTIQWKIYLTNRGSGTAYNVWFDDVLGAGLDYVGAVVDNMTGVTVTADQDHNGNPINGCSIAIAQMTAGERREITFNALLINCNNLTNDASTSWGCVGVECQTVVTDSATVEIPRPLLLNTNVVITPADACSDPDGSIALRNAGQTTCYNLQITENLPVGLNYIPGSTRWRLNGAPVWNGPNAAYDPVVSGSPEQLDWTSAEIAGLAVSNPGDTIEIEYDMQADCPFPGGNVTVGTRYQNPCGQVFNTANSVFTVAFRAPDVIVTKTRVNEPIDCGQLVEWTITVRNNSGYTLPIIWVEDTLGAAFTFDSSVGDPPFTTDDGTFTAPNIVAWELRDVQYNDVVTLTIRAAADNPPCSSGLDDTVRAWWGCGAADGSSATKPGVDPPDNTLCLTSTAVSATNTPTREPSIGFLTIAVNPVTLDSCNDNTQLTVTIRNTGPTDARNVDLVITLPPGITYNAGTSAVTCGGVTTSPAADPAISGNQLIYYDITDNATGKANNLCDTVQAAGGNDTVVLVFSVHSDCYLTADMRFDLYYYDCCEDTQYSTTDSETITALFPDLSVTKVPLNSQVDCASNQTWTITVTNNGSGNAQVVRIEDTLGDWIDYIGSSPAATAMGGQVYGWEITDLGAGNSQVFTITGQLNPDAPQADCTALLRQNNVRAIWGCGTAGDAVDNDPTTIAYDCTHTTWANAPAATLQMPDLVVTGITPVISCTADGTFSGSIQVSVRNQGDGTAFGGFQVQVDDGNGWTGTGSYGSDLAATGTAVINIDLLGWDPDCTPCTYNFTAQVDIGDAVCECREDNNDFGPQSYSPPIPDLEVDSDTLAITCAADGQYRIAGNVTLRNAGCAGTLTQDVPMQFTLFSGAGCGGAQVAQWTQTFTGVNIPAGGTQTFAITNYIVVGDACTSASGCQFSIRIEADYSDTICECDGTDNTLCSDKSFTIPDLRVDSETLAISCSADGQFRIQGNLTIANDGCGANLVTNIPIRLRIYNNNAACAGANGVTSFTQTGVNIPAGGTQTFAINRTLNRNLCTNSTGCQVAVGIELDYNSTICECTNTNNNYCAPNKTVPIPDLQVTGDTLNVTCLQDGQVRVSGDVTVANTGCNAAVAGNLPMRFTLFSDINCGGSQLDQWTETFAGANIAAGSSQVFTIANRDIITNICANSTGCQVSLRIEADPGPSTICECTGGNNTRCSNKTVSVPDLRITSVIPSITCNSDNNLSGTVQVTVNNSGCGAANGAVVRLTSDCGIVFADQSVNIAAGNSTTVTFNYTPNCGACTCIFSAAADPDNTLCECDGTNNTLASAPFTMTVPDIEVQSDTLAVTCAGDNQVTLSGTVTMVNNGCGANLTADIPMRFTLYDNTGCSGNPLSQWTQTLTGVDMASGGGSQVFTITAQTVNTDLCTNSNNCRVSIRVETDYNNSICECDGTDNTYCADNKNVDIPDLEVSGDTLGVTCFTDGQVTVSGTVTMVNNGCGSNLNANIPVRFTLFDNTGCAGNQLLQWTQTFTGVDIASGGGAQVFTITPQNLTANLVDNSTNCRVSILIEPDYTGTICECDNTNNNYCADNKAVDIPDLQVSFDTLGVTCLADGQVTVSGTVTMMNNGCGSNLSANIPVRFTLYDNTGCSGNQLSQWSETLTGVDIAAGGGTQSFTITPQNVTANFCTNSSGCQVSILIEADYTNSICESDGTDNTRCSDKTVNIPDLTVNSITPSFTCVNDGNLQGTVTVNVSNTGCGTANGAVVRLTSDCGITFTDQTINLTASSSTNVTFNYTPNCGACTCIFTATVDPDTALCECDGTNNTLVSAPFTMTVPDIEVQSDTLGVTCAGDNQVTLSGTVTLVNNGCGANLTVDIPVRFTLFDNTGCSGNPLGQWTQTFTGVDMASAGGTQTFTFTAQTVNTNLCANSNNCLVSIRVEADYDNSVCECDGMDNTYCADNKAVDIPDLQVQSDTLGVSCTSDGQVSVSGTVTMTNTGCGANLVANIPVRFTLFDNTGCAGSQLLQWTQTFTGVDIASGGGAQVFTITPQNLTTNLVDNSTNCRVSILIEPDYTDTICECDSTNNTYCADNKPVDIPDIEVQTEALNITCTDDGQYSITGTVTLANNGCGSNLTANIPVRFTFHDNTGDACTGTLIEQWTETFTGVNIAPGATQTFSITPHNASDNLCSEAIQCQITLVVEADYNNTICESDGTDNTLCDNKTLNIPELTINTVANTVVCLNDGNLAGTTVNVSNTGCGSATGVVVRLSSDCGLTFSDQTVNLAAGETRDVFFPFTAGIVTCTCNFTAVIDPDNTICECDGTNNTRTSTQDMIIPDLEIQDEALLITCLDDGMIRVSGTVTLINNGCGPVFTGDIPMRFTLFGRPGCAGSTVNQWTRTFTGVSISSAGGTQTFTILPHDIAANFCTNSLNCRMSIRIEADYTNSICEWDGTDNTYCTDKTSDCLDLEAVSVTANTNCSEDAALNGTIAVTVRSSGGNPITRDFGIRLDDGQGWTSELRYNADLGGTLPLAAGASSTVTFPWTRAFDTHICQFANIIAQVDSQDEICQCTSENDTASTSYRMPLANLRPTAITPSCSSDGNYLVKVTMENNGCSDAGPFTVHLEDNRGHSKDILIYGLDRGSTMDIDFTEWPASGEPNTVTFTAVADFKNEVCEITGTDNTMTYTYTDTSPDLVITAVEPSVSCKSPGNLSGTIAVTIMNNGSGPLTKDFKIIIDDGQGWTIEHYYQADLNGTLPIPVGGTVVIPVNWNRDFTREPYTCNFDNIIVRLDIMADICESAAGNNETFAAYRMSYPDISLESLLPICKEDGQRQLQLVINNKGCGNQDDDFNITFTDNTGQSRTASFTSMGGTLPLKKGDTQTVNLAQWQFDCTGAMIEYTAAVASEGGGCDILDTNNSLTMTHTMEEPDLLFGDIEWICNADGSITFTVSVTNAGYGSADNVPVAIYDENGNTVFGTTVNLAPGASRQFSFTTGSYPQGQDLAFRFVVDENKEFCECNGDNNEKNTSIRCEGGEPQLKLTKFCPPGLEPGGLFRFELKIENTGEIELTNVKIEDFLPDGFQYVTGSASLDGQQIADPQTGQPLVFEIGTLEKGASRTLIFLAVADADIDPGRYCNEARAIAALSAAAPIIASDVVSYKAQCCTVVARQAGEGCCLDVEEWALAPGRFPEGPLSFIEPYFHTESAMYMAYAIFNLWNNIPLEKETLPLFMKERLQNYARSTIEEFYLGSHLGFTLTDGALWLSYAGAYPDQENKDQTQKGWDRKQVDETMTVSQIGFELLALNEAIKEEPQEIKEKLKDIIEKKLTFLALFMDDLPHAWEIKGKEKVEGEVEKKLKQGDLSEFVKKSGDKANLYDKAVLYLAMVELNKGGYSNANIESFGKKLREMLKPIDNNSFDRASLREELTFILALLQESQTGQASAKIKEFEKVLAEDTEGTEEKAPEDKKVLENLHDYALAAAVDYRAGGTLYPEIVKEMKDRFYLKDAGIFADKQPDFTYKMSLNSLAPLVLSFDTGEPEQLEPNAVVLYRTFDEVGLFLKKRNLMIGKPLYSLLKNYPFSEPLLPILSFTRAKRDIAPVFSRDAVVHSTQVKPLGEILIPRTFSKMLSPAYETATSRIAEVSFGLQYLGGKLTGNSERVIKEEGRSFVETGKKYMDSLFASGAGIQLVFLQPSNDDQPTSQSNTIKSFWKSRNLFSKRFLAAGGNDKTLNSFTVLLDETLAIKGQKQSQYNLEPVNSDTRFSTEVLANYLLAETLYIEGGGKHADKAGQMMEIQRRIVETFKEKGYIPKTFGIFVNEETDPQQFTIIPSEEQADKITAAKLYQALGGEFFLSALKKSGGELTVEDLIFLSSAPQLVPYFAEDIKKIVEYKDAEVSNNAADIIGRRLLGMEPKQIAESVENLFKHWDKEAEIPRSDRIENIEKGLIYHFEPQRLLLYLLALQDQTEQFRFKRTLNFFTYMLENEWGVEWTNSFITLPSMEYLVFREEPRENPEPGDLLNVKVRVDNTCPEGFGRARDLGAVYLKALFNPSLVYMGTEPVDGLHVLGDFQWHYDGLPQGAVLEYIYQAYVPSEFNDNFINGSIYAGGRQGFEDFGPDSGIGDRCEDIDHIRRLNFIPLEALQGLVFEDKNVNGIKDDNELGVPNILIKDTRGRMFRSNAEGRFIVLAGDEHEGLQLELKSLPDSYVLLEKPTRLVNRRYAGEIYFPLVPCETVTGFVYVDENQNGAYDEGEARPEGVLLKAKDKEVITGKDGKFVFRNLPTLWKQWIEVKKEQLYYKGNKENLKFQV